MFVRDINHSDNKYNIPHGKRPSFQFYPNDFMRDMQEHPLAITGAWSIVLCAIFWEGGISTKSLKQWSKILGENNKKTLQILKYFEKKKVGNILFLDNQNVTIECRRMVRDEEISQLRRSVGKMGGNPVLTKKENILLNQRSTPSSSTSSSSINTPISPEENDCDFEKFYAAYPGTKSRAKNSKTWQKKKKELGTLFPYKAFFYLTLLS